MPKKYKYLIHSKEQNMYIKWQVHFEIHVLSSLLTGRQVCIKWQFIILISFWFSTRYHCVFIIFKFYTALQRELGFCRGARGWQFSKLSGEVWQIMYRTFQYSKCEPFRWIKTLEGRRIWYEIITCMYWTPFHVVSVT